MTKTQKQQKKNDNNIEQGNELEQRHQDSNDDTGNDSEASDLSDASYIPPKKIRKKIQRKLF